MLSNLCLGILLQVVGNFDEACGESRRAEQASEATPSAWSTRATKRLQLAFFEVLAQRNTAMQRTWVTKLPPPARRVVRHCVGIQLPQVGPASTAMWVCRNTLAGVTGGMQHKDGVQCAARAVQRRAADTRCLAAHVAPPELLQREVAPRARLLLHVRQRDDTRLGHHLVVIRHLRGAGLRRQRAQAGGQR